MFPETGTSASSKARGFRFETAQLILTARIISRQSLQTVGAALWLESDRMGYLPDQLDQASLTNQQDVVRNERRQSIENSAVRNRGGSCIPQAVPQGASLLR